MNKQETANTLSLLDIGKLIVWAVGAGRSKTESIKSLESFGFETGVIAKLINMPSKDVSSILKRTNKK